MNTDGVIHESNLYFQRNIAALRGRQPEVAAVVVKTVLPNLATATTGRDGASTFLLAEPGGKSHWFGGSSMPRVSSQEILAGFVSDGRSVVLPGVLTGYELSEVARKLPPHAAVFVVEDDPVQLRLALSVQDYSAIIECGRVVFILGNAIAVVTELRALFEAHPGYELPVHLLQVPQRTSDQIADLQAEIERAGPQILEIHRRVITQEVASLRTPPRGVLSDLPAVAVLGVDPSPHSVEAARRIERALTQLGWSKAVCIPDAPDHCHLAARVSTVKSVEADFVLLVNSARALVGAGLPSHPPVASWHLAPPGQGRIGALPTDDGQLYFASTGSTVDDLLAAGCAASTIEPCAVAADTVAFRPADGSAQRGYGVVVLADLPDLRPETYSITLDSHVALWHSMIDVVRRHVEDTEPVPSEVLLDEAEELCQARVAEPEVRKQFVRLIDERLVSAGRARAAVDALLRADFAIEVWGMNWSAVEEIGDAAKGPIPGTEELNLLFNAARVVVVLDSSAHGIQTALDAIASGAAVVCREADRAFVKEHPGLVECRSALHFYRSTGDLIGRVGPLIRSSDSSELTVAAALVRKEHSVSRRIEQMVEMIRQRQRRTTNG